MVPLSTALSGLLRLHGQPLPDSPDRDALVARIGSSAWLRFAVGVATNERMPGPNDDEALRLAALDFAAHYPMWIGYRDAVVEVRPPGGPVLRFRIAGGAPLEAAFPAATFAVITAWNPGTGEPRPNERANLKANERLAAHLDARFCERWPAVNAPDTRFREESYAVLGLDLAEAWAVAEGFQQRAIDDIHGGQPFLVSRRRGRVVTWAGILAAA